MGCDMLDIEIYAGFLVLGHNAESGQLRTDKIRILGGMVFAGRMNMKEALSIGRFC